MQQATLCMVELNQLGDQTYQHYILKHLGKKGMLAHLLLTMMKILEIFQIEIFFFWLDSNREFQEPS